MSDLPNDTLQKKYSVASPFTATLLGGIILICSFLLPFVSSDTESVNMLGLLSAYQEIGGALGTIINVVIISLAVLTGFTMLFVLFKKPVAVIIFDILAFVSFFVLSWDFQDRGVVSEHRFSFGISYYLYWIGFIIVFIGAIWFLTVKIKQKKLNNK